MYYVTKTYGHERGLSCCFRQWRATHSHCSKLHGYALKVEVTFKAHTLDERNWVIDFGGLDWLDQLLRNTFDHTLVVAEDDPQMETFYSMEELGMCRLVVMPKVGCEKFAEYLHGKIRRHLFNEMASDYTYRGLDIMFVKISEHGANMASFTD